MNQTIRMLKERKSVRVFRAQDISVKNKETILQCACQAPTAGN